MDLSSLIATLKPGDKLHELKQILVTRKDGGTSQSTVSVEIPWQVVAPAPQPEPPVADKGLESNSVSFRVVPAEPEEKPAVKSKGTKRRSGA